MMYPYWGFGLNILSEIELPELMPATFTQPADVTINMGTTPDTLTGTDIIHKIGVSISPNAYLLQFLSVANFYATNGNIILVEPLPGSDEKSIRLFLLNNVMAALLHQRNAVILHASAFKYQDGVVLLCGPTNAGKSTLLAKMRQKGYQTFTDNCCLVTINSDGICEVTPSYPMINLWEDTFKKLDMPIPHTDNKLRPHLAKYGLSYHSLFATQPLPVKHIFILTKPAYKIQNSITAMPPVSAFSEVHDNIFHRLQIYPMKKQAIHFSTLSKLTSNTPAYLIRSQNATSSITEICDQIGAIIQAKQ